MRPQFNLLPKIPDYLMNNYHHIEDSNLGSNLGSTNVNQGTLQTSELRRSEGYDNYNEIEGIRISSILSHKISSGNEFSNILDIRYYVYEVNNKISSSAGFYGTNIIHESDFFMIKGQSHDHIRGFISKINSVTATEFSDGIYYDISMICNFTYGDPRQIKTLDSFIWNLGISQDPSTFKDLYAPVNLRSSVDSHGNVYAYWEDRNENTKRYKIFKRSLNDNDKYNIILFGNKANSDITLQPIVNNKGTVSCMRILNPGSELSSNRSVEIIGSGTGCHAITNLDLNGGAIINEFSIYDVDLGTNRIHICLNKKKILSQNSYPLINSESVYIGGLPKLSNTEEFCGSLHHIINQNQFVISLKDAKTDLDVIFDHNLRDLIVGTSITSHDGIILKNKGSGYNERTRALVKKIPDNVKWFYDAKAYDNVNRILKRGETCVWSVIAIFDDLNKNFSNLSIEDYLTY